MRRSIYKKTGFTASLSGTMNALTSSVTILAVAFWGAVSDKIGSLKRVLVTLIGSTALLYALVPVIPRMFSGVSDGRFLPFFLILPAIYFFRGATSSMSENFTVRSAAQLHLNYGFIRATGLLVYTDNHSAFAHGWCRKYLHPVRSAGNSRHIAGSNIG